LQRKIESVSFGLLRQRANLEKSFHLGPAEENGRVGGRLRETISIWDGTTMAENDSYPTEGPLGIVPERTPIPCARDPRPTRRSS